MPKTRGLDPLRYLAVESLVERAVQRCDKLSVSGEGDKLRQGILAIRKYLNDRLPDLLFKEFYTRFLYDFFALAAKTCTWKNVRPDSHNRAALEMIMDIDVAGLVCQGYLAHYVQPSDAHRLRRLETLDWGELISWGPVNRGLEYYRLEDLETFIYLRFCRDEDLEIIGRTCSKLQILKIQESRRVTDKGLRALGPCSRLRIIDFEGCSVTFRGVNELLGTNKELEEFNVTDCRNAYLGKSLDVLSCLITTPCPSMRRFAVKYNCVTNAHLRAIVALFPNLTHLKFCCRLSGNLSILNRLKKLVELDFGSHCEGFTVGHLKELLIDVGAKISRLTLGPKIFLSQEDLNFVSQVCVNVEWFGFAHERKLSAPKLVIPHFPKASFLDCSLHHLRRTRFLDPLACRGMYRLEVPTIDQFPSLFDKSDRAFREVGYLREMQLYYDKYSTTRIKRKARKHDSHYPLRPSPQN